MRWLGRSSIIRLQPTFFLSLAAVGREHCLILKKNPMTDFILRLWSDDDGQDIAEYAVMLAVILVLVVGTIRLVGSNANNVFSSAASSIQ